jgi:endonuclease/exonuclease/phosphatase family metal-dependent hydrolase
MNGGRGDDATTAGAGEEGSGAASPSSSGRVRRVALVAALVVVFAVAVQRVASRVFVLNFSVAGPNATALLVAGLASAWTLPVARRVGWGRSLSAGAALLPFAVIVSASGDPTLAGLGALAVVSLATPWLAALGAGDDAFVPGLAAGVGSVVALRAWLGTLPPYATPGGVALVVGVAFVAGSLALNERVPAPGASGVAWLAVFAQATVLAFPAATAAWGGTPYPAVAVATVAGVVVGAAWAALPRGFDGRGRFDARGRAVVAVAFALAWVDVVWVGSLGPVAVFLVQAAFVRLVADGLRDDGLAWLALAQLLAVAAVVAGVLATNWAYVPGGAAFDGHAPLALFALGAVPVAAALAVATRTRVDAGDALPDAARRDALSTVAPAVLAGLSFAPESLAAVDGDDGADDGDDTGPPYRVLTLNVHQWIAGDGGAHNYRAVRDLLDETSPHVVGLQESEGARYTTGSANAVRWLADELDYHYDYGVPTRRGGYGVALLSKYPIESTDVVSMPVESSPPRWALVATLDAPDGPLRTVVTHFQTGIPANDMQLGAAQTVLGELAVDDHDRAVVLGDFNVQPQQDDAYGLLKRRLTDAWTAAGNPETDGGWTYSASDPRQRIDYVWLEGDWTVSACERVGDPTVSDHLGVLATIDPGDE